MPASRLLLAVVALGLIVSACGGPAAAQEVRSDAPRSAANPAAALTLRDATDAFAAELYKIVARKDGNVVLSPYSVAIALAMTRTGAAGETLKQMDTVLRGVAADQNAGFNALDQALAKRPGKYRFGDQDLELELATANRLWGQKDFTFERAFLDELAKDYGAGMQIVDYANAHEAARRTINDWVAARTRDRIKDLIAEGVLASDTRLVLTNAIYLKATWLLKFNDAVAGAFHRADGSVVQAQLMSESEKLGYAKGAGYQAVRLAYAGGLSMVVIVPEAGTFGAFSQSLDGPTLRRVMSGLNTTQVNLAMPKFSFRSKAQLKDALSEMGMPIAFTDRADFSGITKQAPLEIADVIHQAFIAVDEKGTEAAAATAVVMRETSAPLEVIQLTIDRPFLFVIQDDETGAILFMGRVTDPTA
ncbi:MAG TPA: serpin family protein [Candidatus Limnocylindria bacterium]